MIWKMVKCREGMVQIIILDSETTGTEEEDRIIQLAFLVIDTENDDKKKIALYNNHCNPNVAIKYEAMAVHHITPELIDGLPELKDTDAFKMLTVLNKPENILVIHNAKFDLDMLAKEGFENKMQIIDTLNIAKHLYPQLDSHSLQYLRYRGGLYKKEMDYLAGTKIVLKNAHDASADVVFLWILLMEKLLKDHTIEELVELNKTPALEYKMKFGKHRGMLVESLVKEDPSYITWCLNKMDDLDPSMRYTFNYWLKNKGEK